MSFELKLTYVIVSVLFETVYTYFQYKKVKNKLSTNETVVVFKMMFAENPAFKNLKKTVTSWYAITFGALVWIALCQVLFPVTLLFILKRLLFGKSKSEKKAIQHLKEMEEAEARAKEWMRTEGKQSPEIPDAQGNIFGSDGPDFPIRFEDNTEK